MDFDEALSAHLKWKTHLRGVIAGTEKDGSDPALLEREDQCDLGKWIHGDLGLCHSGKLEFQELKRLHADFHRVAGEVVRKADAGDTKGATHHLNVPFLETSTRLVKALLDCKAKCG